MSQAGTSTITVRPPADLAPGEGYTFDFTEFGGFGVPKAGWLAKRGPFDGVVFDSYVNVRLRGKADGMEAPVPADSARTLDANAVGSKVRVENPAGTGTTVAPEDIEVILFGDAREPQPRGSNRLQFSGAAVIADIVPGVRDGRR